MPPLRYGIPALSLARGPSGPLPIQRCCALRANRKAEQ
jgi:hypothetical protein